MNTRRKPGGANSPRRVGADQSSRNRTPVRATGDSAKDIPSRLHLTPGSKELGLGSGSRPEQQRSRPAAADYKDSGSAAEEVDEEPTLACLVQRIPTDSFSEYDNDNGVAEVDAYDDEYGTNDLTMDRCHGNKDFPTDPDDDDDNW